MIYTNAGQIYISKREKKEQVRTQEMLGIEYRKEKWILLTNEFDDLETGGRQQPEEKDDVL